MTEPTLTPPLPPMAPPTGRIITNEDRALLRPRPLLCPGAIVSQPDADFLAAIGLAHTQNMLDMRQLTADLGRMV